MLDSALPYYQAGLGNRLCYELMFNDYNRVIKSAVASPDANYKITDISLEYEIVTQPTLAKYISDEYQNMALLYIQFLKSVAWLAMLNLQVPWSDHLTASAQP